MFANAPISWVLGKNRLIYKNMFQVDMGVLKKNEQFNDQMIDICQFLHKYVPGHEDNQ